MRPRPSPLLALFILSACGGAKTYPVGGPGSGTVNVTAALLAAGEQSAWGLGVYAQGDSGAAIVHFTDAGQISGHFGLARFSAEGALDESFGTGGRVLFQQARHQNQAGLGTIAQPQVAFASDQSIYVAVEVASASGNQAAVMRYTKDGQIDATFGTMGTATFAKKAVSTPVSLHVLADKSAIVALNGADSEGTVPVFGLAHLRPDGTLDPSFGSAGVSFYPQDPRGFQTNDPFTLALPDGSILAGGGPIQTQTSTDSRIIAVHYRPNGQYDRTDRLSGTSWFSKSAVGSLAHGFMVVSGVPNQCSTQLLIAEFADDGTANASFGIDGVQTEPYGRCSPDQFQPTSIAELSDGKLLLAAAVVPGYAFMRLLPNGKLDQSFGLDGYRLAGPTPHINESPELVGAIASREDSILGLEVVIASGGFQCPNMPSGWCGELPTVMLTRLLASGAIDSSFPK